MIRLIPMNAVIHQFEFIHGTIMIRIQIMEWILQQTSSKNWLAPQKGRLNQMIEKSKFNSILTIGIALTNFMNSNQI